MARVEPAGAQLMGIGEVLSRLRDEFEDISLSKIRFLEANGLVSPARTPSGYRKFSLVDLERLRYVLRMQRDHFLPLRVIKDHIDAMNRGFEPPQVASAKPAPPRQLASTDSLERSAAVSAVKLTRAELTEHAGASAALVAALLEYGLIAPDDHSHYDAVALKVTQLATTLSGFGLEPRHLKTVLSSAAREVDLFAPVVTAARSARKPASSAQAEELTLQIASAVIELHALLVRMLVERA